MWTLALAAAVLGAPPARPALAPDVNPRLRIVPQNADGLMQDIEESRDGSRLATHDKGYSPRLWDAKRQILLRVLDGHPDPVRTVAFSPSGATVMTVSPLRLRVWEASRARLVAEWSPKEGGEVASAAFAPDGKQVAVGLESGEVELVSAETGSLLATLGKHTKAVRCLAFRPDGKRLISGADDASGRVWDLDANKPLGSIPGKAAAIRWASFSPSGVRALVTDLGNRVVLVDDTGTVAATYTHVIGERGVANVQMGAVFADGERIVASGEDGTLRLYEPGQTTPVREFKGHEGPVKELRRSPDGRTLATYGTDETLRLWSVATGRELPLDVGDGLPTAGEFGPNSDAFWLGFSEGEVRRYDIQTGKQARSTYGAVEPISKMRLLDNGEALWFRSAAAEGTFGGGRPTRHLMLPPLSASSMFTFEMTWDNQDFSPDGRYVVALSRRQDPPLMVVDMRTGNIPFELKSIGDVGWSLDSKRLAYIPEKGTVAILNLTTNETETVWELPVKEGDGDLARPTWHPNGTWIATSNHPNSHILVWDTESGKIVKDLGVFSDLVDDMQFSPDGSRVFIRGWNVCRMVELESAKVLWESKPGASQSAFVADGARLAMKVYESEQLKVVDAATGKSVFTGKESLPALAVTPDGSCALTSDGTRAKLWDVASGRELATLAHEGAVTDLHFAPNGRPLTVDAIGGMTVWQADGSSKVASVVMMKDGKWLAFDPQGRYDAPDPSAVDGAYFVLDWSGGLEAVAMPQLKGQFYEPKLLAKALGLDKEPVRDVPSLDALHLFPSFALSKSEDGKAVEVEIADRDEGGIGRIVAYLNGKQVASKKGSPFVKLNLDDFRPFMLPENLAPEGNVLTVTVANEAGDLVSPEQTLNVGVPAGLKVPEVRLHALCVGVGNYPGDAADLQAPPSDAQAMSEALKEVSDRLMPGRSDITVLSTAEGDERPTRENIKKWFTEIAAKAGSGDLALVFFAGHGMNRIADKSGYFFLTSEADPGNVTAATGATAAVSGEDLREWLAAVPASKQVVILDTCHSGAASGDLLGAGRSVSGEYERAWQSIKDATGTWILAGSASDQRSYESSNVDHGMLTYALLEAIDRAAPAGLRQTPSGELFVDVERWLEYAATRVESLKQEVGVKGVQRPEFVRSAKSSSFDVGVMSAERRGFLKLAPPKPIVIVGTFQNDEEDPLGLEEAVGSAMRDSKAVKPWFDLAKHPSAYRMAGSYTVEGEAVKVRLVLQVFDDRLARKNLESVEVEGAKSDLASLASKIRTEIEAKVAAASKGRAGG